MFFMFEARLRKRHHSRAERPKLSPPPVSMTKERVLPPPSFNPGGTFHGASFRCWAWLADFRRLGLGAYALPSPLWGDWLKQMALDR